MSKRLDPRITNAVLEFLKKRDPDWVHLEEIYRYLEQNIEFTQKQLELHIQNAGQIEPNWQHDARNLMHGMKRNGIAINPYKNIWGLPIGEEFVPPSWSEIVTKARNLPEIYSVEINGEISSIDSNHKVTKSLIIERIKHLVNCGGLLQIGSLHVWSIVENMILELVEDLEVINSDQTDHNIIIWKPLFVNQEVGQSVSKYLGNIRGAESSLNTAVSDAPVKKRTVPRDEDSTSGGRGIPFAIDKDGRRILAKDPGVEAGFSPNYRCPQCKGLVSRSWPTQGSTRKHHFRHRETRLQPTNKNCEFFSSNDSGLAWENIRKPLKQKYLKSNEFVVSIERSWGGFFIHLELPVPDDCQKITVVDHKGITNNSISAINNWQRNKGKITAKTERNASDFKIIADVEIDGKIEKRTWESKGLNGGDIFVAYTPDDREIRRVRPSPEFSRNSVIDNLSEGTYLVYCSKSKEIDDLLVEGKPLPVEDFFLHYFPVNSGINWPRGWKISEAAPKGMFEVTVAFPIYHKPTNPGFINLEQDQDLVLAVKTPQDEDHAIEIQWWDSEDEEVYLTGDVTMEGWSRHKISNIPNSHNRLQFYLKDSLLRRPTNPIEVASGIGGEMDVDISQMINSQQPGILIQSLEGDTLIETNPFSKELDWTLELNNEFRISSSWAIPKFGDCKVNYMLEGMNVSAERKVKGIEDINGLLLKIFNREEKWKEIVLDWSSSSHKMNGIPILVIKSNVDYRSEKEDGETLIEKLVPVTEEIKPIKETEKLPTSATNLTTPNDSTEIIDQAKNLGISQSANRLCLRPRQFMQEYVKNEIKGSDDINHFLSRVFLCDKKKILFGVKSELRKAFIKDDESKKAIDVRCSKMGCIRWNEMPFRRFLKMGQKASRCRNNRHKFRVNRR